jgi:hypothetical protein
MKANSMSPRQRYITATSLSELLRAALFTSQWESKRLEKNPDKPYTPRITVISRSCSHLFFLPERQRWLACCTCVFPSFFHSMQHTSASRDRIDFIIDAQHCSPENWFCVKVIELFFFFKDCRIIGLLGFETYSMMQWSLTTLSTPDIFPHRLSHEHLTLYRVTPIRMNVLLFYFHSFHRLVKKK